MNIRPSLRYYKLISLTIIIIFYILKGLAYQLSLLKGTEGNDRTHSSVSLRARQIAQDTFQLSDAEVDDFMSDASYSKVVIIMIFCRLRLS